MSNDAEPSLDLLWKQYAEVFENFDDLTLARWMAQTLSQLEGRVWRYSHPLVGAYRLATMVADGRQIWLKRLVNFPANYSEAGCCRAPAVPLLTRDVLESGVICLHCNETLLPFEEIPAPLQADLKQWMDLYSPIHEVAHWDDRRKQSVTSYDHAYENAAQAAEKLLAHLGGTQAPRWLAHYAAIVWEDQDECLEIQPEDISLPS